MERITWASPFSGHPPGLTLVLTMVKSGSGWLCCRARPDGELQRCLTGPWPSVSPSGCDRWLEVVGHPMPRQRVACLHSLRGCNWWGCDLLRTGLP